MEALSGGAAGSLQKKSAEILPECIEILKFLAQLRDHEEQRWPSATVEVLWGRLDSSLEWTVEILEQCDDDDDDDKLHIDRLFQLWTELRDLVRLRLDVTIRLAEDLQLHDLDVAHFDAVSAYAVIICSCVILVYMLYNLKTHTFMCWLYVEPIGKPTL